LARLCQLAENHVVGAPCGIMDQMTAALGRAGQLMALLCQPAEVQGFVPVPPSIRFWGIDSGIRHAVSGSDYTSVRTGAFMGYRIMADLARLVVTGTQVAGRVTVDDPRWQGYLANLSPAEFAGQFAEQLPRELRGDRFLRDYAGTTDAATRVDPNRTYAVYQPTAHPIYEHDRVRRFAGLLAGPLDDAALSEMGELMYASHESYTACGLGSEGTDLLVRRVREAGARRGLFGAKITGGGSGGTVAVLGRAQAAGAVAEIAAAYARQTGRGGTLFADSSGGACEFGLVRLEKMQDVHRYRWPAPESSREHGGAEEPDGRRA
jgi:L-arabinokinase